MAGRGPPSLHRPAAQVSLLFRGQHVNGQTLGGQFGPAQGPAVAAVVLEAVEKGIDVLLVDTFDKEGFAPELAGKTLDQVEAALWNQLEELKQNPPSKEELERVRAQESAVLAAGGRRMVILLSPEATRGAVIVKPCPTRNPSAPVCWPGPARR